MNTQKITCECCSSKRAFVSISNQIVARLVECPLCSEEALTYFLGDLLLAGKKGRIMFEELEELEKVF